MRTKSIALIVAVGAVAAGMYTSVLHRQTPQSPSVIANASPTPMPTPLPTPTSTPDVIVAPTIGHITRHADGYIGATIQMNGYVLVSQKDYVIFSDESTGPVNSYDLPVVGPGLTNLHARQKYTFQGMFVHGGMIFSNHSANHLEISVPPQPITQ